MTVGERDLGHLRRCLALAAEARERGDEPFGSLLVGSSGAVLAEDRNAVVTTGDVTAHPELAMARWASQHLTTAERAAAIVYTSCEHCAMCAGAHVWAGIGRLVFALSGAQLAEHLPPGTPVLDLPCREVFARSSVAVAVEGPVAEVEGEARAVVAGYWG
jgi:tRNA(Arg) A34 adenosine deaminase TadA